MVITTNEISQIISDKDCDYYDDHIKLSDYSSVWTNQSNRTLRRGDKCRRLQMLRQTINPIWRGEMGLNEFEFRTMQPRYNNHQLELFKNNRNDDIRYILFLILFITLLIITYSI